MLFTPFEIKETVDMFMRYKLDIRAITLGVSLLDCVGATGVATRKKIREKLLRVAGPLVKTGCDIETEFGIPIINKRISVTPIALVAASCDEEDFTPFAGTLDETARELGIDFVGGFSALVQKGLSSGDERLIKSLPASLSQTEKVCASVNVASSKSGINMDAVRLMGEMIKKPPKQPPLRTVSAARSLSFFATRRKTTRLWRALFTASRKRKAPLTWGFRAPA